MNQQQHKCIYKQHLDLLIQGYCLNLACQSQCCKLCFEEKHLQHKESWATFSELEQLIKNSTKQISKWQERLELNFQHTQTEYKKAQEYLENETKKLKEIKQMIKQKDLDQLRDNLWELADWQNTLMSFKSCGNLGDMLYQLNQLSERKKEFYDRVMHERIKYKNDYMFNQL